MYRKVYTRIEKYTDLKVRATTTSRCLVSAPTRGPSVACCFVPCYCQGHWSLGSLLIGDPVRKSLSAVMSTGTGSEQRPGVSTHRVQQQQYAGDDSDESQSLDAWKLRYTGSDLAVPRCCTECVTVTVALPHHHWALAAIVRHRCVIATTYMVAPMF